MRLCDVFLVCSCGNLALPSIRGIISRDCDNGHFVAISGRSDDPKVSQTQTVTVVTS
jgi:hypothetical protein